MKPFPFFVLIALLALTTASVLAQYPDEAPRVADAAWDANSLEDLPVEFVFQLTPPVGFTKGSPTGHAVLQLTAPLGSTKGSLTGDVILQFTPPIGSDKGSFKVRTDVEPIPSLGTATDPFAGLIEGDAECDDTGFCIVEMILSAWIPNQTDLEFLLRGELDLTAHEWLSLSVIDTLASDGTWEALHGGQMRGYYLLPFLEQDN